MADKNRGSSNRRQDDNTSSRRRRFSINIGIIVFAVVLIYFLVYLIQYVTGNHVTVYEVQKGQIMVSSNYTGLILRSEDVTYSQESGRINYYCKEGEKAGYGDLICSIDSEGSLAEEITAAGLDGSSLTYSDLLEVQDIITDYVSDYSNKQFYNVYSFGRNLNSDVQENLYLAALEALSSRADLDHLSTFTLVTSDRDGVLAFYTDGFEGVTPDNFSADMYQAADYKKTNLLGNISVSDGQAIYKTVSDENWYIMIPLDEDESEMYREMIEPGSDSFLIKVTFKKDESQTYATAEIRNYDGEDCLVLSFNSSMIRYLSDRYIEVELGEGANEGLKIPNSSIVNKEFLVVPSDYITTQEGSSAPGVIRCYDDKQGVHHEDFVGFDIYYIDDETGNYCVDSEGLSIGDTLQAPDSSSRFIINSTAEHDGVYNINKGYAVFKLIEPISSNGDYTIVETGTDYGLAMYDRIALSGDSIEEGEYTN